MTQRRQPSRKAKQRVRDAFDAEMLIDICERPDYRFSDYAQRYDLPDTPSGRQRFFYHKDNDSDILAVAHLDSVQDDGTCTVVDTSAGLLVCSGVLDDRLGVYVITELLPKLGITCDWLLTTDEEIGQSTAEWFSTDKEYNWMFQFDRGGTDVVMYDYETDALCKLVEDAGAHVGLGSFSDICMLEHLECAGFNWGVGYRDYHGPRAHAWLEDTFRMVARFVKFYRANATTRLVYDRWVRPAKPATTTEDMSDDEFWANHGFIVADCGDYIDLDDSRSYVELDANYIVCNTCGTDPDDLMAPLDDSLGMTA